MNRSLVLCLALILAPAPAVAQAAAPFGPGGAQTPNPQAFAAMQQSHTQLHQLHEQTRARMLTALTPAHRTLLANLVGQLALSVDPNPRAAAASLDAVFAPVEKQSIVTIDAAERTSARGIMQQTRAAFEATLSADQRAEMEQRHAQMQAFEQRHARPAEFSDPGMIVLRTLGAMGGPGRGFGHAGAPLPGM